MQLPKDERRRAVARWKQTGREVSHHESRERLGVDELARRNLRTGMLLDQDQVWLERRVGDPAVPVAGFAKHIAPAKVARITHGLLHGDL